MNLWETLLSERSWTILAGALGGVVRWVTLAEGWRKGTASVIVGAICAAYLSPLVLPAMTPILGGFVGDEANRAGFSGFIIGLAGITVAGFIIDFMAMWTKRNLKDDDKG